MPSSNSTSSVDTDKAVPNQPSAKSSTPTTPPARTNGNNTGGGQ
ncbi:hypothetical protein [Leuconostoc citreum]|nr:hypothetical protein [Leuconostoc citreum]